MAVNVERQTREMSEGRSVGTARLSTETKQAFKTTEFWAMAGVIAAILIATAVSDSLGDIRAWTLVAAVAIGYMISRGLAKSGSKHAAGDERFDRSR